MSHTKENAILKTLTGKNPAEGASVDELIAITNKYPAFGTAKYLLAKKMKQQQHADFHEHAQNAVLYFPNPFWFHFKLNEDALMQEENFLSKIQKIAQSEENSTPQVALPVAEATETTVTQEQPEAVIETVIHGEPSVEEYAVEANEEKVTTTAIEEEQPVIDTEPETEVAIMETATIETPKELPDHDAAPEAEPLETAESVAEHTEPVLHPAEQAIADQTAIAGGPILDEEISGQQEIPEYHEPVATETIPEAEAIIEVGQPDEAILDEEISGQQETPEDHESVTEETATASEATVEKPQPDEVILDEEVTGQQETPEAHEPVTEETIVVEHSVSVAAALPTEPEESPEESDAEMEITAAPLDGNNRISAVLQEQLADFKKPVAENTPVPIETEPYHTVDYFASQGIKLSAELQTQDHLSVKVKKFTDWLKQMKRITPQANELILDEAAEHRVQDSAATSNEPKEVVTEAMAEVLAKQGMNDKAIEVYKKLSFLYPGKSAYFASQIEQLKGI